MRIPGSGSQKRSPADVIAAEDAARFAEEAHPRLERALGADWYDQPGNAADFAAFTLCRLRRARAGEKGGPQHGDEAVREVLGQLSPDALVWIASRAISYMDETGFPEAVEPWLREESS